MARLTSVEREKYRQEGYVVPAWRLPAARVALMRAALDRLIEANPGVRPEKLVSAHLEDGKEGVKGVRDFCKPAGDGLETPFRQDGHYWPIRPLATCTAWIALDASTRENGCLRVIPGSHAGRKLFNHLREDRSDVVLTQRIHDPAFDEASAVDVELEPGQMSLHDVYMIHGATVNRSSRRRAGVAIRYMPGTSVFERKLMPASSASGYLVDFSTRPLWLVRGQDRTGRNFI